ncbi:MAG TPA: flagellar biosynthetic protein FliO [Pirellulales bacterium]
MLVVAALASIAPAPLVAQEFSFRPPTTASSQRDSYPPSPTNSAAQTNSANPSYSVNQATYVGGEQRAVVEPNRASSASTNSSGAGPSSNSVGPISNNGSPKTLRLPPAPQDALSDHGNSGSRTLGAIVSVVGSLAGVLGLFFALAWLLRRGMPNAARRLPNEAVEVLGRAPLAGRQQMHLLRFGNKLLLVCVSPSGVDMLGEITDPLEIDRLAGICQQTEPTSATNSFRQIISQLAGDKSVANSPRAGFAATAGLARRKFAAPSKTGATTGGEAADV